jgi:hypothetical protein
VKTKTYADDYVLSFFHENSPGSITHYLSTAEHALNLIGARHPDLWAAKRFGQPMDLCALKQAAIIEGMAPDPRDRPPFDYQAAAKARRARRRPEGCPG